MIVYVFKIILLLLRITITIIVSINTSCKTVLILSTFEILFEIFGIFAKFGISINIYNIDDIFANMFGVRIISLGLNSIVFEFNCQICSIAGTQ